MIVCIIGQPRRLWYLSHMHTILLIDSFAFLVIFQLFCRLLNFFQNQNFRKILSGKPSECQTVLILIRPDLMSGLIWVKTVCKGYQQTTLVDKVKCACAATQWGYNFIFWSEPSSSAILCV